MKKILALLSALFLVCANVSYAAVGVKSNSTVVGQATDINFKGPTVSSDGSTVTVDETNNSFTTLTVTNGATAPLQYIRIASYLVLYAYQASQRPASGAPIGAIIMFSNANNYADCGTAGGGSKFVVCISDGTNWKSVDNTTI